MKNRNFFMTFSAGLVILMSFNISFAQMFWNQAAQFAGSNTSYVSVPNSSLINLTGSFTIEAWVNPASFAAFSRGIVAKGGSLGTTLRYGVRILSSGKIVISTAGSPRCTTKAAVTLNIWTHVAVTYNSSSNDFKMYLNGNIDTSCAITGAVPVSNTDSLFIGISGSSTPFHGQLDEVRIWARDLSGEEIAKYFRSVIGTSSGIYYGLSISMSFQKESYAGTVFSAKDISGNENNGKARNITSVDLSFRPLQTISQNECAEFDGNNDYLAGKDTSVVSPVSAITLECWVFPRSSGIYNLISKGTSYSMFVDNGVVFASINGSLLSSIQTIQLNRWSHIGFTYDNNSDTVKFIINFNTPRVFSINTIGNISSNTDSLYIGGDPSAGNDFNGFIDEVRISNYSKTISEIDSYKFRSIDASNDPGILTADVCYNLDGYTIDNSENGGPRLYFRNESRFSHPSCIFSQPVSPINRNSANTLSDGFYLDINALRIPATGTTGNISKINNINLKSIFINDVNLFVALNHSNSSNLEIVLTGPNGDSVKVFDRKTTNSADKNLITLFDDNADSSILDGRYSSFYSRVKPENSLNSVFSGDDPKGNWKLSVRDVVSGDTGFIYCWGIQFNNLTERERDLSCVMNIQGFYVQSMHKMLTGDTVQTYLRGFNSPYPVIDSAVGFVNPFGVLSLSFDNAYDNTPYYLVLKHRNSIETWSANPIQFRNSETSLDFSISASNTYGDNVISVDSSPVRFAVYSGDINRDGAIDLSDIVLVFNASNVFTLGYAVTDVSGDNLTDLNDVIITYNNSAAFVRRISPLE